MCSTPVVLSSVCDHLYPELEAIASINKAIRLGNAAETVEELMNPEAQLPIVYQTAANLYQNELFSLQLQGGQVSLGASDWAFGQQLPLSVRLRGATWLLVQSGYELNYQRKTPR